MLKEKIKVLVVDDSAFMRKVISDLLASDPEVEVCGTARNGEDSLEKIEKLKPDVVTMDIEMPILDGISALKEIMRRFPLPVIMLSSLTHEGAIETIKALELGAFDFIGKPSGAISLDIHKVKEELLAKVKLADKNKGNISRITKPRLRDKIINHPIVSSKSETISNGFHSKVDKLQSSNVHTLIAIGTSTGGPRALQNVLTKIPRDIPASIVLVQHMPPAFTKSLADRLDTLCEINVVEASENDILQNGYAYVAPGGHQMEIRKNAKNQFFIHIDRNAELFSGHKPSVDYMFHSIAKIEINKKIVVIMTGMGGDGAKGLVAIKNTGAYAIAEDESTCVVFGMPKVAIGTGSIDSIVPLDKIADQILKQL